MIVTPSTSFNPVTQLSRAGLLYVLLVLLVNIVLLANEMPWWITAVGVVAIVWRLMVFSGKWSFPNTWQKAVLVLGCCAGIAFQYRAGISLDIFVALLLTGLSLKALEVYHNKSAQLFLYVAILALMAYLLYEQGFVASVLALLQMVLIVAALVAINGDHRLLAGRVLVPLKLAVVTMAFAIPLLLFLFVVMPRLPPLWAMPLQKQQARIGLSEEMSPGDVNQLTNSPELVFRASFAETIPQQHDLYWRGAVLDEFDGRSWRNQCDCNYVWKKTGIASRPQGKPAYSVILEPHGNKWLFVLTNAQLADEKVWANGEGLFRFQRELRERIRYDVWDEDVPVPATTLTANEEKRYLHLPEQGNLRTRELAQTWRASSDTPEQIVRRALDLYHQSFVYTTEPPLLGQDSVDEFLFASRKGFCLHFSGAFVFLMRAAGIPARIVMGYQGGEINAGERYITVRQYDAHAWAEIWHAQKGWLRVDPTAAVAPERIEQGFAHLFPESPVFSTMGLPSYSGSSVLGYLRIKLDYLDYLLGRWVLGYDTSVQQSLFERWHLESPWRLLFWFVITFVVFFLVFLMYLQWRDRHARREHPLTARYRQLCEAYARFGTVRSLAETPLQFAARVQQLGLPEHRHFLTVSRCYDEWNYHTAVAIPDETTLLRQMRKLYWRLRWRYRH